MKPKLILISLFILFASHPDISWGGDHDITPRRSGERENLGKYGITSNDPDKIIEKLEDAKKSGSLNAMGYNFLGQLYERKNKNEKAIENFKKAIEKDPDYVEVYNSLGLAYDKTSLENKNELEIEALKKGLEKCKKHPGEFNCAVLFENIASKYFADKIYPSVEKNMLEVIKYSEEGLKKLDKTQNPEDYSTLFYYIGEAYVTLDGKENIVKAEQAFKEVIKYKNSPWYETSENRLRFIKVKLDLLKFDHDHKK